MTEKNKTSRQIEYKKSDGNGIRVLKVAALCFAIISFFATAQGLKEFIFHDAVQAYILSFAIQGTLFVLNLRLPSYIGKLKRMYKVCLITLYAGTLCTSSIFSFIYIANFNYQSTRYINSEIELKNSYQAALTDAEEYIEEGVKLTLDLMVTYAGDLVELSGTGSKTPLEYYEEILAEKTQAEREAFMAYGEYETLTDLQNSSNKLWIETIDTILAGFEKQAADRDTEVAKYNSMCERDPANSATYEAARDAMEAEYEALKIESRTSVMKSLKEKIANGSTDLMNEFLAEALKPSPDADVLESKIGAFVEVVVNGVDSNASGTNGAAANETVTYSDLIDATQKLRAVVEQYIELAELTDNTDGGVSIKGLKEEFYGRADMVPDAAAGSMSQEEMEMPENESLLKEKNLWVRDWDARYKNLERLIGSLPVFSQEALNSMSENAVVNTEILAAFDKDQVVEELSFTSRANLAEVSVMERVFRNLWEGPIRTPGVAALLLAFMCDLASLASGIFIYGIMKRENGS